MLSHRVYYTLKPYLPRELRLQIRRLFAGRKRKRCRDIWPVNESARQPPPGWPGWPEGKKFALVLTHDIEGREGLARCRHLAELELALGFRSSFNFIPEGEYARPRELQEFLRARGFEIGVHDLRHDGWLYASRRGFVKKAARINHYLREWEACGFRSGFMLRNLEWIQDLDIAYDCSTFDTDPFEPQSDAAGTIFPFFVTAAEPRAGRTGYVELPYTLPQDSTLFLLLQEPTNRIWRDKLDWVAKHGGMALVNVHPDYLDARGGGNGTGLRVEDHYTDLLRYIHATYREICWHVLPREMAGYVRSWPGVLSRPAPTQS